jgi:hypothetical protein
MAFWEIREISRSQVESNCVESILYKSYCTIEWGLIMSECHLVMSYSRAVLQPCNPAVVLYYELNIPSYFKKPLRTIYLFLQVMKNQFYKCPTVRVVTN